MAKGRSKFVPQHRHWYGDLPGRDAPLDRKPGMVYGDINYVDGSSLEVSRASALMRGGGVVFGLSGAAAVLFGVYFFQFMFPIEADLLVPFLFLSVALPALAAGAFLVLRTDFSVPRDRPVRFNRARRKVYVYEHAYRVNPFVKWPMAVKVFDWDTLNAEIHRQAGFSGKAYIQRFSLWLVSCRPGTDEVVDRFELKRNWPTTEDLYNTWAYCRQYMSHGPEELPVYPPRRQEISLRRSLFEYMRFLDPTEEGREVRQRMTAGDWAFNVPFIALTFWIFMPMGVGHYIAMRFAPDARWPPEIDAESRSA